MNNQPEQGSQSGYDKVTGDFEIAATLAANAVYQDQDLRTREAIMNHASMVVRLLARKMRFPRDLQLLGELADLNIEMTKIIDRIVLNASPGDPQLEVLQGRAKTEAMWPMLVRPGDEKLTKEKVEKLGLGSALPAGVVPKNPRQSLATPANRLAVGLVDQLQYLSQVVLRIKSNGTGQLANEKEACATLRIHAPDILDKDHNRVLKLLHQVSSHPFSADTLKDWSHFLTEFILIIDPQLERFTELKQVKAAKGRPYIMTEEARFRTELQKFFNPALKNLLS